MSEPAIRTTFLRDMLLAAARLDATARAVAPAGMKAAAAIQLLPPLGWAPASALLELAEAVLGTGGPYALRRWAAEGCLRAMQQPLFAPFIEAARGRGVLEPASLLEHGCLAVPVHLRDCGAFALTQVAEDGATLVQRPIPPELRTPAWLHYAAGFIQAFPIACGLEAAVHVEDGDDDAGAEYHVGWWVPGALDEI